MKDKIILSPGNLQVPDGLSNIIFAVKYSEMLKSCQRDSNMSAGPNKWISCTSGVWRILRLSAEFKQVHTHIYKDTSTHMLTQDWLPLWVLLL